MRVLDRVRKIKESGWSRGAVDWVVMDKTSVGRQERYFREVDYGKGK